MRAIQKRKNDYLQAFTKETLLKDNGNQVASNTLKVYNKQIEYFNTWLLELGKPLNDRTFSEYFDYLKKSKKQGGKSLENGSIKVAKGALKKAIKRKAGKNEANLWITDKLFKEIRTGKKVTTISDSDIFTYEQIDRLLSVSNEQTSCIIDFLYHTACRVTELINAKVKNVKPNGNIKIQIEGKGRKQRKVAISLDSYNEINKVFPGKKGQLKEFIFENHLGGQLDQGNIFRMLQKACQEKLYPEISIRKQPISCHKFRHTRAKHILEMGIDIKALSLFLGHADVATTCEFYLASTVNLDNLLEMDLKRRAGILANKKKTKSNKNWQFDNVKIINKLKGN